MQRNAETKLLKNKQLKTHIYMSPDTDLDCDLYMIDLSSRQEARSMKKTATVLTTTKVRSWVPEGLNTKKDGLTDWLTDRQM
jgi:hypothetical protein